MLEIETQKGRVMTRNLLKALFLLVPLAFVACGGGDGDDDNGGSVSETSVPSADNFVGTYRGSIDVGGDVWSDTITISQGERADLIISIPSLWANQPITADITGESSFSIPTQQLTVTDEFGDEYPGTVAGNGTVIEGNLDSVLDLNIGEFAYRVEINGERQ
jgi:hypothetical protein